MGIFITIVVIGLIIWAVSVSQKAKAAKVALWDSFTAAHAGWDVFVPSSIDQVLAVDHNSRRVAVGSLAKPVEVAWSNLSGCEIERNGETVTTTNRGSQAMGAAVGAILLGPAGLLLGGLTGSKRNVQKVKELSLKVTIDDRVAPVHRIIFVKLPGDGVRPDAGILKPHIERLEHFHALLENAMRSEERARVVNVQATPALDQAGDQIERLWALHQSGALTAEEFATAKGRLLGAASNTPRLT